MTRQDLANDIWRACDIMRRDNNCGGILEYIEHLSWLLFLRFLEVEEETFEAEAAIASRPYVRILEDDYRWSRWAARGADVHGLLVSLWQKERGEADPQKVEAILARDRRHELIIYAEDFLFPYLRSLKGSPEREAIGSIFADMRGVVMDSGYNLRDVLDIIDAIDFRNTDDIHTVSFVYEDLLKRMGSENRVAGEFYTPRPVIRFMVQMVDPKIKQTVYDPACGSAGFLVESYLHMKETQRTARDHKTLQGRTFYGQEKKPLPALLGLINMVLHGVLTPNISRRNTLEENIRDVSERFDVILTNPPFGGRENRQIQRNFPVQGQATELLFLQHIMKKLKQGGRCGVVVPEGIMFRGEAFAAVKKELLENFDLHTIVSLPPGVFAPYSSISTNLLFFDRRGPTKQVWFYELLPPEGTRGYTKTRTIQDSHFDDCRCKWQAREISEVSWIEPVEQLARRGYDLTARNPARNHTVNHRSPTELADSILAKEKEIARLMTRLRVLVREMDENSDAR